MAPRSGRMSGHRSGSGHTVPRSTSWRARAPFRSAVATVAARITLVMRAPHIPAAGRAVGSRAIKERGRHNAARAEAAIVIIIVTITLCVVLSLGKFNNESRYDGRSAAAWLVLSSDTSARTRTTAAAALDYLWPVVRPLQPRIAQAEVHLLDDSDANVRGEATAAVAGMATESPDIVPAIVAVLTRSPRLESRVQAAYALGAAGPAARSAVPALVRAAAAPEAPLRVAAISALGDGGASRDSAVITALVRATTDDDDNVRGVAIEALGRAPVDPGVLVPLALRALHDPAAGVREEAAYVLAESSDTSRMTLAALTEAGSDSDATVRRIAAHALARRQARAKQGENGG